MEGLSGLSYDDVLLRPQYNERGVSRNDVDLTTLDMTGKLKLRVPIMSANMDTITEHAMANFMTSMGGMGFLHRYMTISKNIDEFKLCRGAVAVSFGISATELDRVDALCHVGADYFCLDVAHAHSKAVGDIIPRVRQIIGDRCLIVGNVSTRAGAQYLADQGADIIKVGQGPGGVCSTRTVTGFGVPQVSAILECSTVDRSIIADGGIRSSGDIVKALAFGADYVMIGGILSGCSVTPLPPMQQGNTLVKTYRGMASREAQEGFYGHLPIERAAEGISVTVPYRDDEERVLYDLIGGIKSGVTYGGGDLMTLRRSAYTIITPQGHMESVPHKSR